MQHLMTGVFLVAYQLIISLWSNFSERVCNLYNSPDVVLMLFISSRVTLLHSSTIVALKLFLAGPCPGWLKSAAEESARIVSWPLEFVANPAP